MRELLEQLNSMGFNFQLPAAPEVQLSAADTTITGNVRHDDGFL